MRAADVFVPYLGMRGDVITQSRNALLRLPVDDAHADILSHRRVTFPPRDWVNSVVYASIRFIAIECHVALLLVAKMPESFLAGSLSSVRKCGDTNDSHPTTTSSLSSNVVRN